MMKQTTFLSGFTLRILMWALFGLFLAGVGMLTPGSFLVKDAEAKLGRPASPTSVAGVARRTTHRAERRHHYAHHHRHIGIGSYVAVLPRKSFSQKAGDYRDMGHWCSAVYT